MNEFKLGSIIRSEKPFNILFEGIVVAISKDGLWVAPINVFTGNCEVLGGKVKVELIDWVNAANYKKHQA